MLFILLSSVRSDEIHLVDDHPLLLVTGGEEELLDLQARPEDGPGLGVVLGVAVLRRAPDIVRVESEQLISYITIQRLDVADSSQEFIALCMRTSEEQDMTRWVNSFFMA